MASTILSDNGVLSGSAGIKTTADSVYWIRCKDHIDMTRQGYIGVSKNFNIRFTQHSKCTQNQHFKFAIQKYGWDNLVKTQILIAEKDYCLDIERKLRPVDNIGWNITAGGGKPPSAIGNKYKLGIPAWNKGIPLSSETKEKLSKAHLGQSAWNKGKKSDTPAWNKGITQSDETKAKISLRKKGVKLSDKTKAKMSAARMGKSPYQMTDEIRAKISVALKGIVPWNKGIKSEEQK